MLTDSALLAVAIKSFPRDPVAVSHWWGGDKPAQDHSYITPFIYLCCYLLLSHETFFCRESYRKQFLNDKWKKKKKKPSFLE